jgi:hypothetical protein
MIFYQIRTLYIVRAHDHYIITRPKLWIRRALLKIFLLYAVLCWALSLNLCKIEKKKLLAQVIPWRNIYIYRVYYRVTLPLHRVMGNGKT